METIDIKKTYFKGAAKWMLIVSDNDGNKSTIYATKKTHLIQYIKEYNNKKA